MTRSILNDGKQYRLVFPGNVLPGSDFDEVVFDLARLLKTSPDRAIKLVSGKRRHVKRTFVYEKADQLRVQVLQLGVECELELFDGRTSSSKIKKNKRGKSFPEPENIAMQPAKSNQKSDQTSSREKSYSETMAEFQKHASVNRAQEIIKAELDEAAQSFNAKGDHDKNLDEKNASLKSIRRRLAQFVGVNIDEYLPKFDKFQLGEVPHFAFTWHWPAFFVPFFWAVYRKLWGWSVVIFISTALLPLTNILWGTVANYIYYRHSLKKIKLLRKRYHSGKIDEKLSESGGTSTLALSAALLVILLLINGVYWTGYLSQVFSDWM